MTATRPPAFAAGARTAWWRASAEARSVAALARAGYFGVEPPGRTLEILRTLRAYGPFGATPRIAALRHGDRTAICDEAGELTFTELDALAGRLANALVARGLRPGSTVGILCRNHRMPLAVAFAASRAGISAVWLNTAFSAPQLREVAAREGVDLLVHDAEFDPLVAGLVPRYGRLRCLGETVPAGPVDPAVDDLEVVIAAAGTQAAPPPAVPGRIVLLTSGTTGTPKGAPRAEPRSLTIPGALLDRMPMRAREATVVGPPVFHGTGLVLALLTLALGSTLVLRRHFDPAVLLDDVERHRATTICVVPVMLQRILALGDEEFARRDLGSLRVAFCAGAQLPGTVAARATDRLGDVVYNLYGSTEVSVATLATPADLRVAPTSVGRPALGSRVRVLDDGGREVPAGRSGRIFVGTASPFEGYTGGGGKEVVDGLLATGDVGHLDAAGRLHIEGRDDDMIVSGGENVFPQEVEELLLAEPGIADVAVVGVDDAEFGQRLRAFVVVDRGAVVTVAHVREVVRANLAVYKVPRDVAFVDEIPRNPTGKILRRELVRR